MLNPDESLKLFANNVAWLRCHFGISKKRMAELLRTSTRSIDFLERGEVPSKLSVDVLFCIMEEFGLDAYTLLETDLSATKK